MRLHFVSAFSKIILNESCSYIIYDLLVLQRTPYDKLYAMKAALLITHLPFAKTRKKQRSWGRLALGSARLSGRFYEIHDLRRLRRERK